MAENIGHIHAYILFEFSVEFSEVDISIFLPIFGQNCDKILLSLTQNTPIAKRRRRYQENFRWESTPYPVFSDFSLTQR